MNSVQYITGHPYRILAFILAVLILGYLLFTTAQRHFRDEPIYNFPPPVIADPVEQTIDTTLTTQNR